MSGVPSIVIDAERNVKIPQLGYGSGTSWYSSEDKPINQELVKCIKTALSLGYIHLDTAEAYNTEKEVGIAVKESGVPRNTLFVTTKVAKSMKDPIASLDNSLARLQMDYVDLFLIHHPFFDKASIGIDHVDAWKAVHEIYKSGKAKAVGVSNFRAQDIEEIMALGLVKPAVNQIEFHPYLQQSSIIDACKKHNIAVEVYSPLCPLTHAKDGPVDSVVNEIAKKYNKSPAQVLLRWNFQKGHILVTTSAKEERMKEYLAVTDFTITKEEEKQIDEEGQKKTHRQYWKDKPF